MNWKFVIARRFVDSSTEVAVSMRLMVLQIRTILCPSGNDVVMSVRLRLSLIWIVLTLDTFRFARFVIVWNAFLAILFSSEHFDFGALLLCPLLFGFFYPFPYLLVDLSVLSWSCSTSVSLVFFISLRVSHIFHILSKSSVTKACFCAGVCRVFYQLILLWLRWMRWSTFQNLLQEQAIEQTCRLILLWRSRRCSDSLVYQDWLQSNVKWIS